MTTSAPAESTQRQVTLATPFTNHGLTAADVQMFVDEIKKHPDVSVALLDAVRGEVATLMQGQRFSFNFD